MARNGVLVYQSAAGVRGVNDQRPIALDDIFRIYSMTKPVTAVAVMQLYEQGKFHLTDPVSKFVPELKDLDVYDDGVIRPARREMTMRHLLTHTAGFAYGLSEEHPVDKMYADAGIFAAEDLDEFVARLARLPLMFDPGEDWQYSVAVDVTGLVVQRLSGQPFDEYLRENIFEPLDMGITYLTPPAARRVRRSVGASSTILQLVYKLARPMHDAGPIQSGSGTWPDGQSARRWSCRSRIARC